MKKWLMQTKSLKILSKSNWPNKAKQSFILVDQHNWKTKTKQNNKPLNIHLLSKWHIFKKENEIKTAYKILKNWLSTYMNYKNFKGVLQTEENRISPDRNPDLWQRINNTINDNCMDITVKSLISYAQLKI